MLKLHAVQAQFGDCLILQFGGTSSPRFVLIDGGPADTFQKDLAPSLKAIVKTRKLDLLILSHVDADHIFGILELLAAIEKDNANGKTHRICVSGLWHNSFQKTIDRDGLITQRMQSLMTAAASTNAAMPLAADAFLGINEGHRLRILAKQLKIPINSGFKDDLVMVETAKTSIKFGPATFRIVGPNRANLDALRAEWLDWLDKAERKMELAPSTLSNSDKSVPNLSSIVVLAECDGKSVLLTGDARSDHILDGLEQAKLLKNGKLHVDVLKVQHHGSDRNTTSKFFETVTAGTYVISANGRYNNPDYDTLRWIVEAAHGATRPIRIFVTNATPSTKQLTQTHKPKDYGYTLVVKPKTEHSIEVSTL